MLHVFGTIGKLITLLTSSFLGQPLVILTPEITIFLPPDVTLARFLAHWGSVSRKIAHVGFVTSHFFQPLHIAQVSILPLGLLLLLRVIIEEPQVESFERASSRL